MNEDKFLDLTKRIYDKTKHNLINWTPGSSLNSYQAVLGNGAILIWINEQYPEDYDKPLIGLTFINDRGECIGTVNCYSSSDSDYEILNQIYSSAVNNYMKIDETIKSMYDDLLMR